MAALHRSHQSGEIDDAGAAEQDEGGAPAHRGKGIGTEKTLVIRGHRGDDEDEVARCQHLVERRRLDAVVDQDRWRQPGIEDFGAGAETRQQAVQRASEIAEADDADIGA